jgi:UDP-glucose 4-epimerase
VPGPATAQRFFIVGGAGFIGSHFCDHLLGPDGASAGAAGVTLYDNFTSGREWHFAHHAADARLRVVRGNAEDTAALAAAMDGHDVVIHLASNPDIARAAREPTIDFSQGTALTQSVVEAMRTTTAKRILYASGSGVYGDLGTREAAEDHGPLVPVSTYGASKLAGEALIASYAAMFGLSGCAFRFGNVVGPRQTHGVGFDFARALLRAVAAGEAPVSLRVLGDGTQSKSYIHVADVVRAVLTAHARTAGSFAVYNVATGDYITVREIAELAVACVGLAAADVRFAYTGGDRGWKGDVPVVRLDTDRIKALGWRCERPSREALRQSILAMIPDMQAGRM